MTLTHDRRAELLGACRLFAGLATEELAAIATRAVEIPFEAGHVIARQGEIGTGFFVIASGRVRVVRDGSGIAEMGPGEFFGELSVIDGAPRNAQVVTIEPTVCLGIASWDFEAVLLGQPQVALAVLRAVVSRLRSATADARH
jgi:CRP-like cAMP-binding protein